jgi:hypothetical protein
VEFFIGKDIPEQETQEITQVRITETETGVDKNRKAIRFVLASKLFGAPYAKGYDLEKLLLKDPSHILIARYITEQEKLGERVRASDLFEFLEEDCAELNGIFEFNYEDQLSGEVAERFFMDSVRILEQERLDEEIASLTERYKTATEEEERRSIVQRLAECTQKKNALKRGRK